MTRLFEKYNNDYLAYNLFGTYKVSLKLPSRTNAPLTRKNKNIQIKHLIQDIRKQRN